MNTAFLRAAGALLFAFALAAQAHEAQAREPLHAQMLSTPAVMPPFADGDRQEVALPDLWPRSRPGAQPRPTWYRMPFTAQPAAAWPACFPWLYDGGEGWLDGALVARIAQSDGAVRVPTPRAGASIRFPRAWAIHRINLLHLGAGLVLVAMGGLLTARFVRTRGWLEQMNRTLESRVADREQELAANYARMAALQREHATAQERQRIMREIHDGMGSQLFVALSRLERGGMDARETADVLRGCIAEMRLALDALAPQDLDFRSTLGNFLFRWRVQLVACGIRPRWEIAVPDEDLQVSPHAALQLLRVAQEALTNVVKHAQATAVDVRLRLAGARLELEVRDNGVGTQAQGCAGHGVGNMRVRAEKLGGRLDVAAAQPGTRVTVQVPLAAVRA